MPKSDRFEYIIQKVTELGVDRIIPMRSARTVVKIKRERLGGKRKRWEKIAKEAAKQCGRNGLPEISAVKGLREVLAGAGSYDLAIMPSVVDVGRISVKEALFGFSGKSILLLIGPEGGFSPEEIQGASGSGVRFATLGGNVLRCDTAAIAAVAVIRSELEKT
jgi:16S rRNA (uracil1498-N3)-methyltransferase